MTNKLKPQEKAVFIIYCAYCRKIIRKKLAPRSDHRYGVCPNCVKKSYKNAEREEHAERVA
jgi:hypothetical protein